MQQERLAKKGVYANISCDVQITAVVPNTMPNICLLPEKNKNE